MIKQIAILRTKTKDPIKLSRDEAELRLKMQDVGLNLIQKDGFKTVGAAVLLAIVMWTLGV